MTDEERSERKRQAIILYHKQKKRGGVPFPGSKEVPEGKPNCFNGLTFIATGQMQSLDRDEIAEIVKKYGGRVVTGVSKKVNYMVVGDEAGPMKIAKAEELNIIQISEDEFLDLIREKSGIAKKCTSKHNDKVKEEKVTPKKEKSHHSSKESPKSDKKRKHESPSKPVSHEVKAKKFYGAASPETSKVKSVASLGPSKSVDTSCMAWVDKYKPSSVTQIIGQQGAASNCQKLLSWMSKWHANRKNKNIPKPSIWSTNHDGAYFKAALLSGPPGVGKTTTATLVCKELGFDTVEFNASDTRSKKSLKEEVATLLSNQSLAGYVHGELKKSSSKRVLIMDEVDGMAGNEDRGGIAELILLIKESHIPIICMCNDRNHQKMRSLVNYCYDLRFNKPKLDQIKGAMMSVCFKEGLTLPKGALDEIISGTGNDVRQTLNHLAMYSASKESKMSVEDFKKDAKTAEKDVKIGPWDVIRKVFSVDEHKNMTINDKSSLFFHDYSMAPLFVQENYLSVKPSAPKSQHMKLFAATADSLSRGDMVDKRIRSNMAWSLLPVQAMYSSVLPGEYLEGHCGQINFPGWLGKNSKTTKRKRMAQEIHDHTRTRTSGSRLSVRLDYAPFLMNAIVKPLKDKGIDGVAESLNVIKEYRLLREDIDSLLELTTWPKQKNLMDGVESKVKAALTRAYNKEVQPYSYSVMAAIKKKKVEVSDEIEGYGEDDGLEDASDNDEEDDKLENNAFIKVKKPTASKASTKKAGTSKEKAPAKGKGGKGKAK